MARRVLQQSIVTTFPDPVYVLGHDGRIVETNEACSTMLGYSRKELLQMTVHDISPHFPRKEWTARWENLRSLGTASIETEHRTKKGRLIPVEIIANHVLFNGEEYACAYVRDMTEGKKVSERLKESEEKYRFLYENSPLINLVIGVDGRIKEINQPALDVVGYPEEEVIDRPVLDFVVPGERSKVSGELERSYRGETGPELEVNVRARDGSIRTILFSPGQVLLHEEGRPVSILVSGIDITVRKQDEIQIRADTQRLAALHEAGEALVASLDFSRVVNKCAEIARKLLDADGVVIFLRKPRSGYLKPIASRGAYGIEVFSMELKMGEGVSGRVAVSGKGEIVNRIDLTGNGKQVPGTPAEPESLLSAPLKVKGNVIGVITLDRLGKREFSEDDLSFLEHLANISAAAIENARTYDRAQREIRERKKIENELRKSQEELHRLTTHLQTAREQERIEIARELHDRLGQLLTRLKMDWASLKEKLPHSDERLSRVIETSLDSIQASIETVHRISKELRPTLVEELGLSGAVETEAREFQDRSGVRCRLSTDPGVDTLDPDRSTALYRIVQEALTNVARHARATRVDVILKKKNGDVSLTVTDDGKGITPEKLSDPNSFGILGMRERVYPWGGELTIAPRKGKGTRLKVTLPVKKIPGR
ncbi:MAG: PAS domain S-box protein [Fidelibacterota bacterium]